MSRSATSIQRSNGIVRIVGFLVFVELASGFVQGFYNPLIPLFGRLLHVSDGDLTWFNTVPVLVAGLSVPLLAKLGDLFGHRLMLRIAVLSVLAGVLIMAGSVYLESYALVLVGRAFFGPIAAWLPLEIGLVHHQLGAADSRRAIGFLVSSLTIGTVAGTLIAGAVGTSATESTVGAEFSILLLAPVVLILLSTVAIFFFVPDSGRRTSRSIDLPGVIGLSFIMVVGTIGLGSLGSGGSAVTTGIVFIVLAAVIGFVWYRWEKSRSEPTIDVSLVFSRRLGPVYIAGMMFGVVLYGSIVPLTTFLTSDPSVRGYGFTLTTLALSLVMAMMNIASAISAPLFPWLSGRIGIRGVLVVGVSLPMAVFLIWGLIPQVLAMVALLAVAGLGYGLLMGAMPALVAEQAPPDQTSIATGLYNSLHTLGGAFGGAVFLAVLSLNTSHGVVSADGYRVVWFVAAGAFVVAAIGLMTLRSSVSDAEIRSERSRRSIIKKSTASSK